MATKIEFKKIHWFRTLVTDTGEFLGLMFWLFTFIMIASILS